MFNFTIRKLFLSKTFPRFPNMDFTGLKYDLRATPIDKLFEVYPDLYVLYSEVLSFAWKGKATPHKGLTAEQAVALVVYSYHHTSPLVKQFASMHQRRKEALKLLAYTIENEADLKKQPEIVTYILGANGFINHLAIRLCKFEPNSHKWVELCRKQDMLDDVFLSLKEELGGTEKKSAAEMLSIKIKLEQQAEGLQHRINQLAAEIFTGDSELTLMAAAHDIIEKRKAILVPERQAEKQKLGRK